MAPEATSKPPATKANRAPSSFPSLPSLFSPEQPTQFAESAKLEQAIKANLRGLGYGG